MTDRNRRAGRRLGGALGSIVAGLGVFGVVAAPAAVTPSTPVSQSTDGASATCSVTKPSAAGSQASVRCTLRDTKADGNSVYIVHQVLAFPSKRIEFRGGAGNSRTYPFTITSDTLNYNWHFKVCRNKLLRDNCTGYKYFYIS